METILEIIPGMWKNHTLLKCLLTANIDGVFLLFCFLIVVCFFICEFYGLRNRTAMTFVNISFLAVKFRFFVLLKPKNPLLQPCDD